MRGDGGDHSKDWQRSDASALEEGSGHVRKLPGHAVGRHTSGRVVGVFVDVSWACRGRVVGVSWACRGRVVGVSDVSCLQQVTVARVDGEVEEGRLVRHGRLPEPRLVAVEQPPHRLRLAGRRCGLQLCPACSVKTSDIRGCGTVQCIQHRVSTSEAKAVECSQIRAVSSAGWSTLRLAFRF